MVSLLFSTQQKKNNKSIKLWVYTYSYVLPVLTHNVEEHLVLEEVLGGALLSMVNQYRS